MAVIPNTNVNLATNIRDVLNAAGGSVGNDVASFFTSEANINPFSKHKPVVLATDFCQDYDISQPNYYIGWWTGTSENCGLVPKQVTSFKNIPDAMDGDMNGWTYQLPTGGENAPFRLGDFMGYDTDAVPMLEGFSVASRVSNQFSSNKVTGACMMIFESDTSLSFADFPRFKDYYLGMYIVQDNGGQYRYKTSETTLGNNGTTVAISAYGLPVGSWTAYPFICSVMQDGETLMAGAYWTLPKNNSASFQVVSSLVAINIVAEKFVRLGIIEVKVYVSSISGPSSFTNNSLRIRFADKDFSDIMEAGEMSVTLDDITGIPTDGTSTLIHSFGYEITNADLLANPKVWVSLQSANYLQGVVPMSEVDDTLTPE